MHKNITSNILKCISKKSTHPMNYRHIKVGKLRIKLYVFTPYQQKESRTYLPYFQNTHQ